MSENKKLVLHIGAGKTGTTSIQKALIHNQDILKGLGIKYLGMMLEFSNLKLAEWQFEDGWLTFLSDDKEKRINDIVDILKADFKESSYSTFVWSNEAFFNKPQIFLECIKRLLKENNNLTIEVIGYLRNHESWLFSAYIQWSLKHKTYKGPVKSFKEWYTPDKADFSSVVQRWNDEPNIITTFRNYDSLVDVVDNFMSFIGVTEKSYSKLTRKNNRASNVSLMLWAIFNNIHEESCHPRLLQGLLQSADLIYTDIPDINIDDLYLNEDCLELIRADCRKDREKINMLLRERGQAEISEEEVTIPDLTVSNGQIMSAFLKLLDNQNKRIVNLEAKLNEIYEVRK